MNKEVKQKAPCGALQSCSIVRNGGACCIWHVFCPLHQVVERTYNIEKNTFYVGCTKECSDEIVRRLKEEKLPVCMNCLMPLLTGAPFCIKCQGVSDPDITKLLRQPPSRQAITKCKQFFADHPEELGESPIRTLTAHHCLCFECFIPSLNGACSAHVSNRPKMKLHCKKRRCGRPVDFEFALFPDLKASGLCMGCWHQSKKLTDVECMGCVSIPLECKDARCIDSIQVLSTNIRAFRDKL